jgi:hypothetical protein
MRLRAPTWICAAGVVLLQASTVAAQATPSPAGATVRCASGDDERRHCPANVSAGVLLVRTMGSAACLLGRTWGYDDAGIWVEDGCSAEFMVRSASANPDSHAAPRESETDSTAADAAVAPEEESRETWGYFDPGEGFLVGRNEFGELSISIYALVRYLNQLGNDTFVDHLGREQPVDRRNDIYSHRVIVFFKGWVGVPKLVYQIALWTVNTTDQDAIFGNIGYQFAKWLNVYGGINGNPGTRSLQGSHPYWLGHDRVMADEYFRPYFTQGVWANGEVAPGLWYNVMAGNTSSTLGVTAALLDRRLTYGASVWWTPTTHEFGPRGAFGDWEWHEQVATRFGASSTFSTEQRLTDVLSPPGNTTLKLADSLNLFATDALAPGVTVTEARYRIVSVDAGMKLRGFFVQTELYRRWLDDFRADGPLPVADVDDWGFYVQGSFYPWRHRLELYGATSQIFGDTSAGFARASEYLGGANFYPTHSRNHRLNVQVINVNGSPVSSTFGYYTGGQDGVTVSVAASVFF